MNKITDEMYDVFKAGLEAVNGVCVRASKADLGKAIADVFAQAGIADTCIVETPLMKEAGVVDALKAAGIEVYADHIRKNAETVKGGVTEAQYGIASLGSLIQGRDDIDERLIATMCEYYIGIIKGSAIVPEYDDMFDLLCELPELPNYVGFITGPSRTADIECVSTVGVHGPLCLAAIVVEDE
ncbi:MAG: lactate utilization protein C [Eubacteriales bacterium]|nr:lactate utilization protein C [Eubacteriales bacterium]